MRKQRDLSSGTRRTLQSVGAAVRCGVLLSLTLFALLGSMAHQPSPAARATSQPNIILILTDDTRVDDMGALPYVQQALGAAGMTFSNSFVTTPACCPSRVSTLRGQYTHNHGVVSNGREFDGQPSSFLKFYESGEDESTIATWLQDTGYRTGLIGKYMNFYPVTAPLDYVPPGWDDWAAQLRGRYYGFLLVENGDIVRYSKKSEAYSTDVFTEKAAEFIRQSAGSGQPFFLYLAPRAPHSDTEPAARHSNAFHDIAAPRGPAFDEPGVSDKPRRIQSLPRFTEQDTQALDARQRGRWQTLLAVDEMVATLDTVLEETGTLDNTYVVFTSDNGYFLGEHRLQFGKSAPYDEAIKVPLIVRGPGVAPGQVQDRLVLNSDLAPTFADIAGATPPAFVDGRSFLPLLRGETIPWRSNILVTYAGEQGLALATSTEGEVVPGSEGDSADVDQGDEGPEGSSPAPAFRLLATESLRYIEYDTGEIELYDIARDPAQLDNLAAVTPATEMQRLSAALAALATCAGASCRAAEDIPVG